MLIRQGNNASAFWLHYRERTFKTSTFTVNDIQDACWQRIARTGRKADKHDAPSRLRGGKDKLTKILVLGQQNTAFAKRQTDDVLIGSATRRFGNGNYIIVRRTQRPHYREVATLVCEKALHLSVFR